MGTRTDKRYAWRQLLPLGLQWAFKIKHAFVLLEYFCNTVKYSRNISYAYWLAATRWKVFRSLRCAEVQFWQMTRGNHTARSFVCKWLSFPSANKPPSKPAPKFLTDFTFRLWRLYEKSSSFPLRARTTITPLSLSFSAALAIAPKCPGGFCLEINERWDNTQTSSWQGAMERNILPAGRLR